MLSTTKYRIDYKFNNDNTFESTYLKIVTVHVHFIWKTPGRDYVYRFIFVNRDVRVPELHKINTEREGATTGQRERETDRERESVVASSILLLFFVCKVCTHACTHARTHARTRVNDEWT